jgi:hypothetical protein
MKPFKSVTASWVLWALALACVFLFGYCVPAKSAQTIERSIDGRHILLNAYKCDGISGTGYKLYRIENNVVKSGCWINDGKYVIETIDDEVTKYDKRLFEMN